MESLLLYDKINECLSMLVQENSHILCFAGIIGVQEDSRRRDRSNLPQRDQSLMELVLFWSDLARPGVTAA